MRKEIVNMTDFEYIASKLDDGELLCQIAEEAGELVQAALKLRRALNGVNPTPVTVPKAYDELLKEIADVHNAETAWMVKLGISFADTVPDGEEKRVRWAKRLRERDEVNAGRLPAVAAEEHENMLAAVSSPAFVDAFRGLAKAVSESTGKMYVEVIDSAKDRLANGIEPHNVMSYFARLAFRGGAEK